MYNFKNLIYFYNEIIRNVDNFQFVFDNIC